MQTVKRRFWEVLGVAEPGDRVSRAVDIFLITLILLNVGAVILSSMAQVRADYATALFGFEVFTVVVFTVEYVARVWSCTVEPEFARPVVGRLRFAGRPLRVIDLLAFVPFYLPFLGVDLRVIRLLRVLRILRVAKLARYSSALQLIGRVTCTRKEELFVTTIFMLILLIIASTLMYYAESDIQPQHFGDIPSTMWWAVVTLTTVGYGDVYPITGLGKLIAALIAILGIGMVALPAGILGSGFVEEMQTRKGNVARCPHCGKPKV